jgi:hypothetical protein
MNDRFSGGSAQQAMINQRFYEQQGLVGMRTQEPESRPVELTASEIRSALLKRAEKLRSNLSHVDAWRAELKLVEDMMAAYDAPLCGSDGG